MTAEHRRMDRLAAVEILRGMAEADMTVADLAAKLEVSERRVWGYLRRLIDGRFGFAGDAVTIAAAMGYRYTITSHSIAPREAPHA